MPYKQRIKTLEESHRLVENQIDVLQHSENPDQVKLKNLIEYKDKYLSELRVLRRAQYESSQSVDFDDDR